MVVAWPVLGAGCLMPTLLVAMLMKLYVCPAWPVNVAEVAVVFIKKESKPAPLSET